MAPRNWRSFLLLLLLCCCLFWPVHGMVPEPQNVRLNSIMFDSVLQWDPPNFHKENVTYTVQHRTEFNRTFTDMCRRIVFTECNVSNIPIYGRSIIRVRTEFENKQSNWVDISFIPHIETTIGPPTVEVEATKTGVLDVQLTEPFFTRSGGKHSLKSVYPSVIYRIRIWKNHSDEQVLDMNSTYTFQIIPDLDPMTTYCLKAQAFVEDLNKGGQWSEPICTNTTNTTDLGLNPTLLTVILLLVVVFPFFSLIIFHIYKQIKYVFFPSYTLPHHFKEFLSKPAYGSQFLVSQSQEEHAYDKIIVLSEESKNVANESEKQLGNAEQQLEKSPEEPSQHKGGSDCISLVHT